jgi:adenylyl-sulfate kinase
MCDGCSGNDSRIAMSPEIHWHETSVQSKERFDRHGHRGMTIWLTGLSGSGKSTIGNAVCRQLFDDGMEIVVLDADNVRHGLNSDLGFSDKDRSENVRRLGEVSALLASFGTIVLVTAISPFRIDRQRVRMSHELQTIPFMEVHIATSVEECGIRDTKGLYARVRTGEYQGLSGVDAPYESPTNAEVVIKTEGRTVSDCATVLSEVIRQQLL